MPSENLISFSEAQFKKLFPFYLLLDSNKQVLSYGSSLGKICPIPQFATFSELFRLKRPSEDINQTDLSQLLDQVIVLECRQNPHIVLRGQFELTNNQQAIFVGTPWFGAIDKVVENNLTIQDFALHDPMIDLLHVLKMQEITTNDIKELLTRVNRQKKELLESEGQMSSLVQNLRTGILLEDENQRIVLTNKMFCDLFSISIPPELLKGADCSTSAETSKHLFKKPEEFVTRINLILDKRQIVLSENLELVDGRILERSYIPIFVADQFKGHLWKYTDITQRERVNRKIIEQEEKYRNIIENMNLGILEVSLNDEIQYVNNSFCELSGYTPEELIGKKTHQLFGDRATHTVIEQKKQLRSAGISDGYEIKVKNKSGDFRHWFVSGAPNYNFQGELIGSIGIHLDVTKQKKLEQQLRIAKNKAEESSKAKESFLANMSHEIRTPLNAIVGMIRELKRSELSIQQNTYVKHVDSASQHLQSIINNILDISKIEAGEFALEHQPFSLLTVFEETRAIAAPLVKEKLLNCSVEVSPELAHAFVGDPHRIRQVMLNIVSNSVKFTDHGGISVTCQVTKNWPDKQEVHIQLKDTGIGMEKDYLKSLFNKFTQESITIARKYGGTGLGMAITHELIQLMGGEIKVQSEKGLGTQFDIWLTLEKHVDVIQRRDISTSETKPSLKGLKVLLVEDNEMNRLVATNSLSREGILVEEAENGLVAIELLSKKTFDIILMDLQMPVMDGLEATTIIRNELEIKTPIIALTANAFKNEIERCFKMGMNDYVTKPFDEAVLIGTLVKHSGRSNNNDNMNTSSVGHNSASLYNLSQIIALSHGNSQFVKRLLELFCTSMPESLTELANALALKDAAKISSVAHKMKPVLSNMGVTSLDSAIQELERIDRVSTDWSSVRTLIETITQTVNQVIDELENELSLLTVA